MDREPKDCPCGADRVHRVEYQTLNERLHEVRERVQRLETILARGLLLLAANLAGVAVSLAREFANV